MFFFLKCFFFLNFIQCFTVWNSCRINEQVWTFTVNKTDDRGWFLQRLLFSARPETCAPSAIWSQKTRYKLFFYEFKCHLSSCSSLNCLSKPISLLFWRSEHVSSYLFIHVKEMFIVNSWFFSWTSHENYKIKPQIIRCRQRYEV